MDETSAPTTASVGSAPSRTLEWVPFPIAYPMALALDEKRASGERLDNLIFAGEQTLRIGALVLLGEYLATEGHSPQVERAIAGLRMPHWEEWRQLGSALAKYWRRDLQDKPERDSWFPSLVAGWLAFNNPGKRERWTELLEGLKGLQAGPAQSGCDVLHRARNDLAHRRGTRDKEAERRDGATLARLAPVLLRALSEMFPRGTVRLIRRVCETPLRVVSLLGPHLDLRFDAEDLSPDWEELFSSTEIAVLGADGGVPLYPLATPSKGNEANSEPGNSESGEQAMFLDQVGGKHVVVLGVRKYEERADLLHQFLSELARRKVDFGLARNETKRWTIAEWSVNSSRELIDRELRGRKYFPECYVERASADARVARLLEKSGKGLLILGEAGSGKSSLLCRLVDYLTSTDNVSDLGASGVSSGELSHYFASRGRSDVVLFLSGRGDYGGDHGFTADQLLCEAVMRRAGVRPGAFHNLTDFVADLGSTSSQDKLESRQVWLILDALNEADRFADLVTALDAFLPALGVHPWLRLVVSMRSGAFHALQRRHVDRARHSRNFLANAQWLHNFERETPGAEPAPYLALTPFDLSDEGPRAYLMRQEKLPERACAVPYGRLSPRIKRVLLDPLHLHLFHETYRSLDAIDPDLDERSLRDAYLDALCADLPHMSVTLERIGRLMFQRRIPFLPVDVADQWLSNWREGMDPVVRAVKLDPIEELVSASVLMRPAEEGLGIDRSLVGWGFSHQKLCEQVLVRELRRQIAPRLHPNAAELVAWARIAARTAGNEVAFVELEGALSMMATEAVRQGDGVTVVALLDLEEEAVRASLLSSAIRALGRAWGRHETGEPAAIAVLTSLVAAVRNSPLRCTRLMESTAIARQWLRRSGATAAATALERELVAAMRHLVQTFPEDIAIKRHLAASLQTLALAAGGAGQGNDARICCEEALAQIRDLVAGDADNSELKRTLALTLSTLAHLAFEEDRRGVFAGDDRPGRFHEARSCYEEAISIVRGLVQSEPRANLKEFLGALLTNLGRLSRWDERSDENALYREALSLLRDLAVTDPDRPKGNLAYVLDCLGSLARAQKRYEDARNHLEESLRIRRASAAAEPARTDLKEEVADSLSNLGALLRAESRDAEAHDFEQAAIQVRRELVEAEPTRNDLRRALLASLNNLERMADRAKRTDEAREYCEQAVEVESELVRRAGAGGNADLARSLCDSLERLGEFTRTAGRPAQARGYFEEALGRRRDLMAAYPDRADIKERFAMRVWILGSLASDLGDMEAARRYCDEAVLTMTELAQAEITEQRLRDLALLLLGRAKVAEADGRGDDARNDEQHAARVFGAYEAMRLRQN